MTPRHPIRSLNRVGYHQHSSGFNYRSIRLHLHQDLCGSNTDDRLHSRQNTPTKGVGNVKPNSATPVIFRNNRYSINIWIRFSTVGTNNVSYHDLHITIHFGTNHQHLFIVSFYFYIDLTRLVLVPYLPMPLPSWEVVRRTLLSFTPFLSEGRKRKRITSFQLHQYSCTYVHWRLHTDHRKEPGPRTKSLTPSCSFYKLSLQDPNTL